MLSVLFAALLTILRIGVPVALLLTIGEIIRPKNQVRENMRGT